MYDKKRVNEKQNQYPNNAPYWGIVGFVKLGNKEKQVRRQVIRS